MKQTTSVIIKNPLAEEKIVELWCGDKLLGEVSQEQETFALEIFAPTKDRWRLGLEDFIEMLRRAREELENR